MLRFNTSSNLFEFAPEMATYRDRGKATYKYLPTARDRDWLIEFVAKWYHHTELNIFPLIPTQAQKDRLDEVNQFDDLVDWQVGEYSEYVEFGSVNDDTYNEHLSPKLEDEATQEANRERVRKQIRADLEYERFLVETGGLTLPNGTEIQTDRTAQSQLERAHISLQQGFIDHVDWKAPLGWVAMTEADITPLAKVSAQFVQGSFSAEMQVDQLLSDVDQFPDVSSLYEFDWRTWFATEIESLKARIFEGLVPSAPSEDETPAEEPTTETEDEVDTDPTPGDPSEDDETTTEPQ